jgi:hypothetical protein
LHFFKIRASAVQPVQEQQLKRLLALIQLSTRVVSGVLALGIPLISLLVAAVAAAAPQDEPFIPPLVIFASVSCVGIIVGTSFALFAFGYPKRFGKTAYRWAVAALLLLPLIGGCVLIHATRTQFPPIKTALVLIVFTAWLQILCVRPTLLQMAEKLR